MVDSFKPNIRAIGSPTTVPITHRPSATPAAIITTFLQGPSLDLPMFFVQTVYPKCSEKD